MVDHFFSSCVLSHANGTFGRFDQFLTKGKVNEKQQNNTQMIIVNT